MSNNMLVYENVEQVLNDDSVIITTGFEGLKSGEIIDSIYAADKNITT